jgi:SAM-dependent methyltransferase
MTYYELHDIWYQDLVDKGYVSWDREKDLKSINEQSISKVLKHFIDKNFIETKGKSSFDLGCGTGNVAFMLDDLGFESFGIDISKVAIDQANINAKELNKNIKFEVGDLLKDKPNQKFDFISDSSCLHCIFFDKERSAFYKYVKESLKSEESTFFLHTMISSDDMSNMTSQPYLLLDESYLWSKGKPEWDIEWHEVKGQKVFPHRRILSKEELTNEIDSNGFKIVESKINNVEKSADTFIALLKQK